MVRHKKKYVSRRSYGRQLIPTYFSSRYNRIAARQEKFEWIQIDTVFFIKVFRFETG